MKYILMLLLITSCAMIKNPSPQAQGKKAYLGEGLASHKKGYVRKAFQEELEKRGYIVYSVPYTYKEKIDADLCIVHSFGWKLARMGAICKILITLDARAWDASNNDKWIKPKTVGIHFNYYQKSWPIGHPVKGAEKNINMGRVGHTKLPSVVKDMVLRDIDEGG